VLGLVDSLRDWLPGWLEWHRRAARYLGDGTVAVTRSVTRRPAGPTGIGTATARRPLTGSRT
jgi:hypothetical protein